MVSDNYVVAVIVKMLMTMGLIEEEFLFYSENIDSDGGHELAVLKVYSRSLVNYFLILAQ